MACLDERFSENRFEGQQIWIRFSRRMHFKSPSMKFITIFLVEIFFKILYIIFSSIFHGYLVSMVSISSNNDLSPIIWQSITRGYLSSLVPESCGNKFTGVYSNSSFCELMTVCNYGEIGLRRVSQNDIDDKSILVQVMAWCQCWPGYISPYGSSREGAPVLLPGFAIKW